MPQALKMRNGVWEWDPSLGEQCAADYDRVIWNVPRPPYEQWTVDGDTVVEVATPIEPPAPPDPLAQPMSKLALRRALRARGLEEALDGFLASSPQALHDWQDSQVVRMDDPLMAQMLPGFRQAAGLTDEDVLALVTEAQVQ